MNRETRIQKIQAIINRDKDDPFGKLEIPWEDDLETMESYKIPIEYLVYNKYNGRILSRTKSLESQKHEIDAESDEGKALIEKLLWDSKISRNQKTLESIINYGQQKVGIITRDGIIIDGNRRVMLLKKSRKCDYFKTVVLPVTLEENPLEIEKLETSYQMGEDEKLGYNPIEKYLKADGLYKKLSGKSFSIEDNDKESIEKIANWMGEENPTVEDYLKVMETMDDYLDYLSYNGIYTQLDNREDQFISLTNWLNNFYVEGSEKGFDGYRNDDVDDLKIIAYDYIRVKYEGKKLRSIAHGRKENHFFGDKRIWNNFKNLHFKNIEPIKDNEEEIDFDSQDLKSHLDDRDSKFFESTKNEHGESFIDENWDTNFTQLNFNKSAGQPEKLVKNAKKALESIDQKHKAFSSPAVLNQIEELNLYTMDILKKKSTNSLLAQIIKLLESVNIINTNDSTDELLEKAKKIQSLAYKLEKKVKKIR